VKRIRQIIVALLGLFYVGLLYPLYTDLWHSKWLNEDLTVEIRTLYSHSSKLACSPSTGAFRRHNEHRPSQRA
jgi:hypothetical protein